MQLYNKLSAKERSALIDEAGLDDKFKINLDDY